MIVVPTQQPTGIERPSIGYCTNVHPGVTLDQIKQNLERESLAVKRIVSPAQPMGIGLWLSSTATEELMNLDERSRFRDWLQQRELVPFTVNAFPAGDFHQKVVKHNVYQPTWADQPRLEYTRRVAAILADLLPAGSHGTISTLPLGWPAATNQSSDLPASETFLQACGENLTQAADAFSDLQESHDVQLRLCIEPEPGCILDTCDDVVQYFDRFIVRSNQSDDQLQRAKRHLGVCHDICHSAVMFEPQSLALDQYAESDITVGKVQVSSAIEVDFDSMDDSTAAKALAQLAAFAEPRYLHQTGIRKNGSTFFHEDLPIALAAIDVDGPTGKWRVHFHVPIHEPTFGLIDSTQPQILECVDWFNSSGQSGVHFEVETYAWNVLPEPLRPDRLADGIAREMQWFIERLSR